MALTIAWPVNRLRHLAQKEKEGERATVRPAHLIIALRMAASTLPLSNMYLERSFADQDQARAPVAIKAMAASWPDCTLPYGMQFVDGKRSSTRVKTKANASGLKILPFTPDP